MSEFSKKEKVSSEIQTAGFVPDFSKSSLLERKSFLVADTLNWKLLGMIKFVKTA